VTAPAIVMFLENGSNGTEGMCMKIDVTAQLNIIASYWEYLAHVARQLPGAEQQEMRAHSLL